MHDLLQQVLQQLINALSVGSVYALVALGYTMVYGILRLINFAHGDIYMLGAFIGLLLTNWLLRINAYLGGHAATAIFLSVPVAMLGCALIGMLIERLAYKPLRYAPRHSLLITAIGISFLLEYLMQWKFTSTPQAYARDPWLSNEIHLFGDAAISTQRLLVIIIAVVLMIALQVLVQYTKMGKAMRAVSVDQDAARLMGINVDRVISFTFALGSALAGAAGVLIGMQFDVEPLMGIGIGLKAFVAAVVGGIGLIPGALFGSYALSFIETLVKGLDLTRWHIQSSLLADAVAFAILILILLFKPSGLLGKSTRDKV